MKERLCFALVLLALSQAASARVTAVVADIGPGTNPYHEVFRRPGWTAHPCTVIPGFPCSAPALNLTLGADYATNLAADADTWAAFRTNTVYWVPGTNLLLLTLRPWADYGFPIPTGHAGALGGHGVATSAAAGNACPECYVLVVQDAQSGADGMPIRHIADQLPWVDFVAATNITGYGGYVDQTYVAQAYSEATRHLSRSGRLFFAATGNTAVTSLITVPAHTYDLPPWVVLVGGAQTHDVFWEFDSGLYEGCSADNAFAGKPPEMVGDFSQILPLAETAAGLAVLSGTSFATPQVAGRFARVLVGVRERLGDARGPGALWAGPPRGAAALADGRLTSEELREVMAVSSTYFRTASYDAACAVYALNYLMPLVPVATPPWPQMGWGIPLESGRADAVRAVLGEVAPAPKPAEAVTYMDALMAARRAAFPGD